MSKPKLAADSVIQKNLLAQRRKVFLTEDESVLCRVIHLDGEPFHRIYPGASYEEDFDGAIARLNRKDELFFLEEGDHFRFHLGENESVIDIELYLTLPIHTFVFSSETDKRIIAGKRSESILFSIDKENEGYRLSFASEEADCIKHSFFAQLMYGEEQRLIQVLPGNDLFFILDENPERFTLYLYE